MTEIEEQGTDNYHWAIMPEDNITSSSAVYSYRSWASVSVAFFSFLKKKSLICAFLTRLAVLVVHDSCLDILTPRNLIFSTRATTSPCMWRGICSLPFVLLKSMMTSFIHLLRGGLGHCFRTTLPDMSPRAYILPHRYLRLVPLLLYRWQIFFSFFSLLINVWKYITWQHTMKTEFCWSCLLVRDARNVC